MSYGFIDSASIHMVLAALQRRKPEEWSQWEWKTAQAITCALWTHPNMSIAPDPCFRTPSALPLDQLLRNLSPFLSHPPQHKNEVMKKAKRWARRYPSKLRAACQQLAPDPNFQKWLDWYISDWWLNHIRLHESLFDWELIYELSLVIGCKQEDLSKVYKLSNDPAQVTLWARHRPQTEDFRLVLEAFIISALIRGRYHDDLARESSLHILHHPMREFILSRKSPKYVFPIPNTALYLSSMVLCSASSERTLEGKVALWAENICKVKLASEAERIDLRSKEIDSVALETAIHAVKLIDIRMHSRLLENFLDAALTAGVAALGLILSPWASAVLSLSQYGISKKFKLTERAVRIASLREKRLRDLALSEPGRLTATLITKP